MSLHPLADNAIALRLIELTRDFGGQRVVDGVSLNVRRGEFVSLLGPSGSGKTTTLRMIAGFLTPTSGQVELNGSDITTIPAHRRNIGMVFQGYALFPHMTVFENIAFPLTMRKRARAEIEKRVGEVLELVRLGSLGARYPRQLSGGQQQRVALARAIVFEPQLILMDEPLGSLDAKLRVAMQTEIIRISRALQATVLYVTHDQEEALAMSDRIALFNAGRIEQVGGGSDLYEAPVSEFAADFVGESNKLFGTLRCSANGSWFLDGSPPLPVVPTKSVDLLDGAESILVIRPERISLTEAGGQTGARDSLSGSVTAVLYLGPTSRVEVATGRGNVIARMPSSDAARLSVGTSVLVWWEAADALLFAV